MNRIPEIRKPSDKSDKSDKSDPSDPLLSAARAHFTAAGEALRRGCAEALITGLHLIALHSRSNAQGSRNDSRLGDPAGGFEAACEVIGIKRPTAYRWMNACRNAALRLTLLMEEDDIAAELPTHGTPRWEQWENGLRQLSAGMSLSRLMIGQNKDSTEDHRYEVLLSGDEDGSARAAALLADVAEGRYSLAAAVKALGSQEAYDRLRAEGGEKIRKDPVYLDYDPIGKHAVGLIPKAFVTLCNGFAKWDGYDPDARREMSRHFLEVVKSAPRELTDLLKK